MLGSLLPKEVMQTLDMRQCIELDEISAHLAFQGKHAKLFACDAAVMTAMCWA